MFAFETPSYEPLLPPLLQGQGLQGVENQMEDIERECVKNPEQFNVSATPWKCSEFSLESLAERCARNPERFNMIKSECHQLIPPSS